MRHVIPLLMLCLPSISLAQDDRDPVALALASDAPGQVKPDDPHWDLELMYFHSQWDEGLASSRERLAAHPDDPDLYWHVARFLFEMGEKEGVSKAEKIALYEEMIALSEAGLERFPDHAHLQFALGIGKGRLGTSRGVLRSLSLVKDVEAAWSYAASSDYAYRSIDGGEHLPCDAQLTLGIFYRLVPDSWFVKVLSGTRGDIDRSIRSLETANQCSSGDIGILKELGVAHMCRADRNDTPEDIELGRQFMQQALRVPARDDSTDLIDHKHIRMLLDDPTLACEYSRDGQQELDEEAMARLQAEQ